MHWDRWTARRKEEVLAAIEQGGDPAEFGVTPEEADEWRRLFALAGKSGLRATRLQKYRAATRRRGIRGADGHQVTNDPH